MKIINNQRNKKWKVATFISVFFIICLIATVIALSLMGKNKNNYTVPSCGINDNQIKLDEPKNPSIFHDLTETEISGLFQYLYSQPSLNLVKPSEALVNTSYIYTAEIYLPDKQKVLNFLENKSQKPTREAVVTIFRGDAKTPYIQEILVGPLPSPNYMKDIPGRRKPIPFIFRPLTAPDMNNLLGKVIDILHIQVKELLKESFGGSLKNCGNECLAIRFPVPMSPAVSGADARKLWLNMCQFIEFYSLYPVDFAVLAEAHFTDVTIHEVWYNGRVFRSLQALNEGYKNGSVEKIQIPFPTTTEREYGKLSPRGIQFEETFRQEPIQIEPDGKRYSIEHNHVEYRGWSFDYRMSTTSGPQIYDVRFRGERIVYEMSLQEIMVLYSGNKPSQMFANYFDSLSLIGKEAKFLVAGVDCPIHATFIDTIHVSESSEKPVRIKNAFCLFELNTGYPLRRHHAYASARGSFYEGLSNIVLTFRSIATIANYDYIFDFIFYQNGVIQVKAVSTGYIMATFPNKEESEYGMKVQDYVNGNIHIHAFNFKVDVDVKGISNRYETLDIVPHSVPNEYSTVANARHHMTKFTRNLKRTEQEAAYKFNFDNPKYLIFYNEKEKNPYGNPKAYRILTTGMVKQLYPEGEGNEPSASWARYQMAVTKHKDTERWSSSMFSYLDSNDPVVQFQKYLDDNENIVDEDLVAWVTLGVHHIPHTEDLPVTPSSGMDLSFHLLPFNYFAEDPAIASRHSVRIEFKDKSKPHNGIFIQRHETSKDIKCLPAMNPFFQYLTKHPEHILEIPPQS